MKYLQKSVLNVIFSTENNQKNLEDLLSDILTWLDLNYSPHTAFALS